MAARAPADWTTHHTLVKMMVKVAALEFDMAIRLVSQIPCQDPRCINARNDYVSSKKCSRCIALQHLQAMKRHDE